VKPRLGVNIDHVATLRQQRSEAYPSLEKAAQIALNAGADQITIHLREDRRHIQDHDVRTIQKICADFKKLFNFEMGCAPDIIALACEIKPDWVCLVPEKRQERTTEGGLAMTDPDVFKLIEHSVAKILKASPQTKVSLFVESRLEVLQQCLKLPIHAVEIHTGDYAHSFHQEKSLDEYLVKFRQGHDLIKSKSLGFHAGHGLSDASVAPLLKEGIFEEYNIGHWIISESLFMGLAEVVKRLKIQMEQ
jgi:pyridoxine 5-phosphate synthase